MTDSVVIIILLLVFHWKILKLIKQLNRAVIVVWKLLKIITWCMIGLFPIDYSQLIADILKKNPILLNWQSR
jgi:hypothetical protein